MIRFCDKEVCCVMEDELNRQQLISYFMNGHRDELVCIVNDMGQFVGSITYGSLLGNNLEESIIKDYLALNADVWENGRRYFKSHQKIFGQAAMIPVLNLNHQLVCFAWQDDEANRELRMLDELREHKSVLGFKDVFPEYDCVIINDCNELAWYFVQYLKEQNVLIKTRGELWSELGIGEDAEALDYRCFTVHGEGFGKKEEGIGRRNSVSAEFECIDRIYEENIREGIISDAEGNAEDFCEWLKGKEIGILGVGEIAANAYDLLLGHGIDISCFVSESPGMSALFGKKVLTRTEAVSCLGDEGVFLDAGFKYSAWGFGETDLYHYLGYKRNRSFFLLQDYMEISENGLLNILKHLILHSSEKLVLFGDSGLCLKLNQILERQIEIEKDQVVYCDILHTYEKNEIRMSQVEPEELSVECECLLLLPKYVECFISAPQNMGYRDYLKSKYEEAFAKYHITKVIDYSIDQAAFMKHEEIEYKSYKQKDTALKAGKILLGSINPFSGHIFFRGILACHPDILIMDYGYLSDNLFFVCIRLALENSSDIMPVFWKLYDRTLEFCKKSWILNRRIFHQSMERMLAVKEKFTSQEIFIMLHAAYAETKGKKVEDISKAVIFWEPHIYCDLVESYALWLNEACDSGYILNVVRNSYIRAGSFLRALEKKEMIGINVLSNILYMQNVEKKEYKGFWRVVMRFEDIKCAPQKELQFLCNELGIKWSDKLLEVEASYGDIVGFDLRPVYRTYEEYFSIFDRFRISLINGPWQKKYGYPYVSSLDFERRELREMFSKKFRFEEKWMFQSKETETKFLKWRQRLVNDCLLAIRRLEVIEL